MLKQILTKGEDRGCARDHVPAVREGFKIDEAGYSDILKRVRDGEFEQQLHERLELAEQDKRNAVELATTRVTSELQKSATAKDSEIQGLKARLDAGDVARKLAVAVALSALEKERDALANQLAQAKLDKQAYHGDAGTSFAAPHVAGAWTRSEVNHELSTSSPWFQAIVMRSQCSGTSWSSR